MKNHKIALAESQKSLPFLYWIPKMHKNPSKQRYIAASHTCSTKPLSKMITFCLKLIQTTCANYCTTIKKTRGFNRNWIVNNSVEVLNEITRCNKCKKVLNIRTYDCSTLYTSIPHKSLKTQMTWVINQCFNASSRKFIKIDKHSASWTQSRGENKVTWNKYQLIHQIKWLIDNIYVFCGDCLFRQVIGIPMGTDCAPFLANLYLYSYEHQWLTKKYEEKDFESLKKFNFCFRYLDDLLCINNDQLMDSVMQDIYPKELELTSDDAVTSTHYLDLDLEIVDEKINYNLYDKRDAFGFKIINFPNLSGNIPAKQSYGVFASQLIRYARCCQHFRHFAERSKLLIDRLTNQGFQLALLKTVFEKFVVTYYELLFKYGDCDFEKMC